MNEIAIELTNAYGAFERIFRVIRHRRFSVCQCEIRTHMSNKFQMNLCVTGAKPVETLLEQLRKLVDVQTIRLIEPESIKVNEAMPQLETGVLSYAT